MIRWSVLAAGAAVVVGAAVVTASFIPPKPEDAVAKPDEVKGAVLGQKIGFFNMAKVVKHSKRASSEAAKLNAERFNLSVRMLEWKARHTKLQSDIVSEKDADEKEKMAMELVQLARKIEDREREIAKVLNERAAAIITGLYDDVRTASVEVAKERGLVAIFSYPDATTPEELEFPQIKELKLKPPAAMPFYLDPSVDLTDEMLQRLDAKFNAGK